MFLRRCILIEITSCLFGFFLPKILGNLVYKATCENYLAQSRLVRCFKNRSPKSNGQSFLLKNKPVLLGILLGGVPPFLDIATCPRDIDIHPNKTLAFFHKQKSMVIHLSLPVSG